MFENVIFSNDGPNIRM